MHPSLPAGTHRCLLGCCALIYTFLYVEVQRAGLHVPSRQWHHYTSFLGGEEILQRNLARAWKQEIAIKQIRANVSADVCTRVQNDDKS